MGGVQKLGGSGNVLIDIPRTVWQSSHMVLGLEITSLINGRKLQMHY